MANIVIGALFFTIIAYSAYRSWESIKSNSCPGCSGGCSLQCKGCKEYKH